MRLPQTPPNTGELWKKLLGGGPTGQEKLWRAARPTVRGKYLHWDELRHRAVPSGLSLEEWWMAIKLSRMSTAWTLPLQATDGRPFHYSLVESIPEALHRIDQEAGGQIELPEQITNPETRDRYYVSSLIEEAITSSQLEGATTTREVAKEMVRTGRKPRDRSEQMILNNFRAMRRIGKLRHESLTKDMLFELHRLVTEGTLDDPSAVGRLRLESEHIVVQERQGQVVHVPPPADELEARLAAMCDFANGNTPM